MSGRVSTDPDNPEPVRATKNARQAEDRYLWLQRVKDLIGHEISESRSIWQLWMILGNGMQAVYEEMTLIERLRFLSTELLLACLYVCAAGWFAWSHIGSLRVFALLVVPSAFADAAGQSSSAPYGIKVAIMTMYSIAVVVVLLMSAYSALLRKPPLQSAKDVLKLTLGFATGQITAAGFLL